MLRLSVALLCGAVIGLERQWRQRVTGMRTNTLVALGSTLFVLLGGLLPGGDSQGRLASYVVSGIGFLGGGVILRDGLNIRGLDTAATLWCTAAVGTLAGSGFVAFAIIATASVLIVNLLLRPLGQLIREAPFQGNAQEVFYKLSCTSYTAEHSQIKLMLLQALGMSTLTLISLRSHHEGPTDFCYLEADVRSPKRQDEVPEQIAMRLSLEPGVSAVSWRASEARKVEDVHFADLNTLVTDH